MEGPNPAVLALSAAGYGGQTQGRGNYRNRPWDGRLYLGHRLYRPAAAAGLNKPADSNPRRSTTGHPLVRTAGDRTAVRNPPALS